MNASMNYDIYEEIRKHKNSSDKLLSEDFCVLEAIDDIIKSKKGVDGYVPSPVEYFSCIMSTLNSSEDHCRSVLSIMVYFMNSCYSFCKSLFLLFRKM